MPTGYLSTIGGDCSANGFITLAIGQSKTCSIIVDDVGFNPTGKLTVRKIVINDDGGTLLANDVQLFVDGVQKLNGVEYMYSTGTYTISENNPPGYTATFGGDCDTSGSVTISQGDVLECTITNDDL
jgi:hypothetical protein